MKRLVTAALLIVTAALVGVGMQIAPQRLLETIAGTVTRSDTNTPLPNVRVELTSEDYVRLPTGYEKGCKPQPDYEVSNKRRFVNTDSNGKFTFTDIIPGRYYLSAEREGFLRTNFGQLGRYSLGTLLRIGPQPEAVLTASVAQGGQRGGLDRESERIPNGAGAPSAIGDSSVLAGTSRILLQDLAIPMTPASTIVGTVMNDEGASLAAASVHAYQFRYAPMNGRTLKSVRATLTGENGDYRLFWLNPGRYIVAAAHTRYSVLPWVSTLNLSPNLPSADAGLPSIFFPTSTSAVDALPVRLNPGEEPRADLRLRERQRFTMRLQLVADRLPANATLIFIPYGGDLCAALDYGISGSRDGAFEIRDVPEGLYMAMAMAGRDVISELAPVRVDRDSPREIQLPVVPSIEVRGNIFFDVPPGTDLGPLRVSLVRSGQEVSQSATTTVDPATGRFSIPGIGPGAYFPVVDLPPGAFVQNVSASKFQVDKPEDCDPKIQTPTYSYQDRHGHFDPLKPLRIPSVVPNAAECLAIRISFGYPLLGYVYDRLRRPARAAFVVAIPKSVWAQEDDRGATPPDRYLTAITDDTGFFRLIGAAQGVTADSLAQAEYHVYAFEDLDPNMIYDPGFSDRFRTRGSFEWRELWFDGKWVVNKIAILTAAGWNTCGGLDSPSVIARCYLTQIPAEETAEIQ